MPRSYYSKSLSLFFEDESSKILGELVKNHDFSLVDLQKNAWLSQISILKEQLKDLKSGHIILEYSIPRIGRRVDAILIYEGNIFVMEFKIGEKNYSRHSIDQAMDYALDLKNFHKDSHDAQIVPILVATKAPDVKTIINKFKDGVFETILCNENNLSKSIAEVSYRYTGQEINPLKWENSVYKPTPTIIQAAQALYRKHNVREISHSESGAINLSKTTEAINRIIDKSKKEKMKSICFITGVPGAGKTLAGLNIAYERYNFIKEEHTVFLSGNGPLVKVLQEALARDKIATSRKITKKKALKDTKTLIHNIHHFRDDALKSENPPNERVVIFDEAQRAWTHKQTSSFMRRKKGVSDFEMSEPEFLISILDRHKEWAVIICLIGGGQEINIGEAGLSEWFSALRRRYGHWNLFLSTEITDEEYTHGANIGELTRGLKKSSCPELHLGSSIRSFRSENVSKLVKDILDCKIQESQSLLCEIGEKYPIFITRNIEHAKEWLKQQSRGTERIGLIASSRADRLKPEGIFIQSKIDAPTWFLNDKEDVRSSNFLEDVGTEFDVQGLELDWACVAWDADLRYVDNGWSYNSFRGSKWQKIQDKERIHYLKNTYRVLLTRARQGLIILIPKGNTNDLTRSPKFYDGTYNYLREIGIREI